LDRGIVYPGQIPLDVDILSANRNALIAIGYALQATLGTGIYADGLACNPTLPASMQVTIGLGSLTTMSTIDASAYGTIAADLDNLVKMGINPFGSTSFTLTAPGTSGQSINYLIEAQLLESDGLPISLPYYNAAAPSQPFTGPNNNQAQQNTVRIQRVGLQLKAGSPSAAGTQQTPTVDAGWVGLYTLTVNFGQTTVTATSITVYPGAPFIGAKIPALAPFFSPTFTGIPAAPTAPAGTSTTQIATTAFMGNYGHFGTSVPLIVSQSWTVPAGVFKIFIKVQAAGGGASVSISTQVGGAGGGGGGYAEGIFGVTPGAVLAVIIGTGGAGGVVGVNPNGSTGGTTAVTGYIQATGGLGAQYAPGATSGGAGGAGLSGTLQIQGSAGGDGFIGFTLPGYGGASHLGGSSRAGTYSVSSSGNGTSYGGGGSGSYAAGQNVSGGQGAIGIAVIYY
jgi:hypothetical protein